MPGRFEFSREDNLTGFWSGEYWYAAAAAPTPFSAHIADEAGGVSGTTLEPVTFGAPGLSELSADITGSRSGLSLAFIKLYHPAPGVHRNPIHYAGVLDAKFTVIEGDWRFPDGFSGRFILTRSSRGAKAAVKRRAVKAGQPGGR